MSEQVSFLVLLMLGPCVVALMEVTKVLAKLGWDKKLTKEVKFRVALITAFIIGTVATLLSGQVSVVTILQQIVALVVDFPGFWQLFPALGEIFQSIVAAGSIVYAVSQAVYGLLKKRLEEVGWLAT